MPKFAYYAKTRQGEPKKGIINTVNKDIALKILQDNGFTVINIENIDEKKGINLNFNLDIFDGVPQREMVVFSRLLSVLLDVQMSLNQSLTILRDQTKNKFFNGVLTQVINDIQDGNSFSESLAKHPKAFTPFFVAIIKSGEKTGGLQEALNFLADYLEDSYGIDSKIRGALMYPAFVTLVFFGIGLYIAYSVLPGLVDTLQDLSSAELPITTRFIIWGSDFLQAYIWWVIGGLLATVGGLWYYSKTTSGKKVWDRFQLKLPVFGDLFTKIYVSRFVINMQTLLKASIPIIESLKITASVVGNTVFEDIINESIKGVKEGGQMTDSILKRKEFPSISAQIIQVGEKTGKLDEVLGTIGRFYKAEIENIVKNLTALLEPIIMVIIGLGVAIFIMAILLPIYNATGSITA